MAKKPDDEDGGGLLGRLGRGLRRGVEKGKQLGKLGLLKAELSNVHSDRRDTLAEIGEVLVRRLGEVGTATIENDDPELAPLFEELAQHDKIIKTMERKIERLQKEG